MLEEHMCETSSVRQAVLDKLFPPRIAHPLVSDIP